MQSSNTFVCDIADLQPLRCKGFIIDDQSLFIVRTDNNYHAYINSCPHRQIPLDWGDDQFLDYDGELIQCSSHGALFSVESGQCLAGPCIGQHLKKLAITITDDKLYICPQPQ